MKATVEKTELIRFESADLGYSRKKVLVGLNFAIHKGEFLGIVGANGSGKTTLLRSILGILAPQRGEIRRFEEAGRIRFGYVPQRAYLDELFPLTVREVVLMGSYGRIGPLRAVSSRDSDSAMQCLEQVGIASLANRRYKSLSGGEKQRALIARALLSDPTILVLDEPTDGMDLAGQRSILDLILKIRSESSVTVLFVTHRLNELINVAQRLILLHEGTCRIGGVEDLLKGEVLREIYDVDARVEQVGGQRVILT